MKTTSLFFVFVACLSTAFAQNNSLPPSGKVGIGTTSPNEALEVNGNMSVDSSMVVKDTLLVEDDARVMHNMRVDGATEMNDVIIYGTTWMKGLTDLDSQDFGILVAKEDGTVMKTGPGSLFPAPAEPIGFCDLESNPYSTNPYWISQPNKLYTACRDVFVGIATETPRVNLDVIGTTYSERLALSSNPLSFNSEKLLIGGYSAQSNANLVRVSNTSNDLFTLNNRGDLTLNGTFNLTSLSSSPFIVHNASEKILQLESDGLLRTRRVRVDQDTWADYVFQEGYSLMSLGDLQKFISENEHLPGVPTTEEVQENGVDLAEMNEILLKKIEELTLYTIQQQEIIDNLQSQENEDANSEEDKFEQLLKMLESQQQEIEILKAQVAN